MRGPRPRQLATLVLLPPLLAGAVYFGFRLALIAVSFWQLWLLSLAVVVVLMVLPALRAEAEPVVEPRHSTTEVRDRPFAEANRWEDRLSWSDNDPQRFNLVLRERLVVLIAERLRLRHGVELRADPERARDILPQPLFTVATRSFGAVPSISEMDEIVRLIETI